MKDRKAFTIFSKRCTHAQEHVFKKMKLGMILEETEMFMFVYCYCVSG